MLGYKFIHNSTTSNRGVGILIKRELLNCFNILNTVKDIENNYILIDVEYNGSRFTAGSVYGANTNEGLPMYDSLQEKITGLGNRDIILGGDWNATFDNKNVNENLDVLNMVNIPSLRRSNRILEMCTALDLTDPYRIIYPLTREFTFTPHGVDQINRSRLDFFLISKNLCASIVNVIIPHSLSSTSFDHKPVHLLFHKRKGKFNYFVKDNYIMGEEFKTGVHIAVVECYIIHAILDQHFTELHKDDILTRIGTVHGLLTEIQELKTREVKEGTNRLLTLRIEGIRADIRECLEQLPNFEALNTLTLAPTPDIFLETLILCVKNNALKEQQRSIQISTARKNELIGRLKNLKIDNRPNFLLIQRTENELSRVIEAELRSELENFKRFETLNEEKITPHFMSMVKGSFKSEKPTLIRNDHGNEFESIEEQKNFVGTYYKNIYKKNLEVAVADNPENISNFLGEDILLEPVVVSAKLNNAEREDLDLPLTIEELTQSINESNLKSAPGSNGISNKFIKTYWEFFKRPLLNYANYAFETGRLTNSFRTADIKLIPKKGGDLTKIKNWRPISLLNCFYKCISRAFARRLKKYMNKLTPCAQKGYANGRYCQEVLMSVVDTIENCKNIGKKGAMLCLDIQKAFDSISHGYLKNVFQFYNFGPNISRWLTLLSMNRAARIVLDTDLATEIFELEQGNAQGDTISPFLFNLGYQILLFKIQFDLQITGVIDRVTLPADFPPLPVDVQQVPPRVYALADDATVLCKMEHASLLRIKSILEEFRILSGLACNVEKTTLLQFGSDDPIDNAILALGFDVREEVTLLGLKINRNCSNFVSSKLDIKEKIQKQIRFWVRFDLSLPGRINVAKTFMYAQINYLGCFLPTDENFLEGIETIIETYVKGSLNISKERMSLPREDGGLGLFSLKTFLNSQCCAWAKRAQNLDDNWKLRLYSKSLGSVLNLRSEFFNKVSEPILYQIASSTEAFLYAFGKTKENIKETYALNNNITYGGEQPLNLDKTFFGEDFFAENRYKIGNIRVCHIIQNDGTVITHDQFVNVSNIRIPVEKFTVIRRACEEAIERNLKDNLFDKKSTDLQTFVNRFKKGSKNFRRVLTGNLREEIPRNINTFAANTQTYIGLEMGRKINKLWGLSFLDNDMRSFLFKLHNNILGLNSRVTHFIADHSPICTFCRISLRNDAENEDTYHLFYTCPITEHFRDSFFRWAYNEANHYVIGRNELFLVQEENNVLNSRSLIKTLISKLYLKYIWDCRNRYAIPDLELAKENICQKLKTITSLSNIMREHLNDSGLVAVFQL